MNLIIVSKVNVMRHSLFDLELYLDAKHEQIILTELLQTEFLLTFDQQRVDWAEFATSAFISQPFRVYLLKDCRLPELILEPTVEK